MTGPVDLALTEGVTWTHPPGDPEHGRQLSPVYAADHGGIVDPVAVGWAAAVALVTLRGLAIVAGAEGHGWTRTAHAHAGDALGHVLTVAAAARTRPAGEPMAGWWSPVRDHDTGTLVTVTAAAGEWSAVERGEDAPPLPEDLWHLHPLVMAWSREWPAALARVWAGAVMLTDPAGAHGGAPTAAQAVAAGAVVAGMVHGEACRYAPPVDAQAVDRDPGSVWVPHPRAWMLGQAEILLTRLVATSARVHPGPPVVGRGWGGGALVWSRWASTHELGARFARDVVAPGWWPGE